MKRMLCLLSAALLLLTMAACGKNADVLPVSTTAVPTETTTETSPEDTTPTETTQPAEPTEVTEPTQPQEPVVESSWQTAYADLAEDFGRIIAFRTSPGFNEAWESGICLPEVSQTLVDALDASAKDLETMIIELSMVNDPCTEDDFGYILRDLNADDTPELFWVHNDHRICAVFTWHEGTPVLLDAYWSRYCGYIGENNTLYARGSGGAEITQATVYVLHQGNLTEAFCFGTDTDSNGNIQFYESVGDTTAPTEEERVKTLYNAYPPEHSQFWLSLPVTPLTEAPTQYVSAAGEGQLPYLQTIHREDFSVWSGPGYDYAFVDTVQDATVYTIVAEIYDFKGNLWGRLRSGLGWVDLTLLRQEEAEPPILSANFSHADHLADETNHFYKGDTSGTAFTVFVYETVTDMTFCPVYYEETPVYEDPIFSLDTWEPDKAFVADVLFPGDMSLYAIRFTDSAGTRHTYLVGISGRNGSLYLTQVP